MTTWALEPTISAATIERVRRLCEDSKRRFPNPDLGELQPPAVGCSPPELHDELKRLLTTGTNDGLDTHELRRIGATFALENAIGKPGSELHHIIGGIVSCLPAGTRLPDLDNAVWARVIDLGRAIGFFSVYHPQDSRTKSVCASGQRLANAGYRLAAQDGRYGFRDNELQRAVGVLQSRLDSLGYINVLHDIFETLQSSSQFVYGVFTPVRAYQHGRNVASIPYGFLVNLAVRSPAHGQRQRNTRQKKCRAFNLARDIVSALNIEPYDQFGLINTAPSLIEEKLRELALFDHIFALTQQWPPDVTPVVLTEFFSGVEEDVWSELGWGVRDAVTLFQLLAASRYHDPVVIHLSTLETALPADRVSRMLPEFTHEPGQVNAAYDSPLAAQKANLMFKPFIRLRQDQFIMPASSLAGPAMYEAILAAVSRLNDAKSIDRLRGKGTERVVRALLDKSSLQVTAMGASYRADGNRECDFVVESAQYVLFVECKAKALTRGAMAGVAGDALLDFAGGMFAAYAQALRHERTIREHGRIDFIDDTPPLILRGRAVCHLSVTLLGHGSIQDRVVLWLLHDALLRGSVSASQTHAKQRQVEKLNSLLDSMRNDLQAMAELGVDLRETGLNFASLNVGSLAVMLRGVNDLETFVNRIMSRGTYGTHDPLFEYAQKMKSGLFD